MNLKCAYIEPGVGKVELFDVTQHIMLSDGIYALDVSVNSEYDPSSTPSVLPKIYQYNGDFYMVYPEILIPYTSWYDIKISEVDGALSDGEQHTDEDLPEHAQDVNNSWLLTGRVYTYNNDPFIMMPSGCKVCSNGPLGMNASYINIDAGAININGRNNNPHDVLKVYSNSHTTAENVVKVATSAPSAAPAFVGLFHIDTTAKKAYISVGTSAASDWKQITA